MSISAISSNSYVPAAAPAAPTPQAAPPAAKPVDRPHDGDADDRGSAAPASPAAKSSGAVQAGLAALKAGG